MNLKNLRSVSYFSWPVEVWAGLAVAVTAIIVGLVAGDNPRLTVLLVAVPIFMFAFVFLRGAPWLFVGLLQGSFSILVYYISLLGFNIPSGITIPALAFVALLGMALNLIYLPDAKKSLLSPMSFLVFIFSLLVIAGVFYSWHSAASEKAVLYLATNVVSFAVVLTLSRQQRQYLYTFFIVVALIVSFGVFFNFLTGGLGAGRGRYGAFNLESLGAARSIGLGLVVLLYVQFYQRQRVYIIILSLGILLAASRGSMVAVIAVMLSYPVLSIQSGFSLRRPLLLVSTLVLSVVLLGAIVNVYRPDALAQNWGPFRMIEETSLEDANALGRFNHWTNAIEDVRMSPLLGMGTAGYGGSSPWRNLTTWSYPHNIFLEILSEWGLLGFTVFLFMLARYWFNTRQLLRLAQRAKDNWWLTETLIIASIFIFALVRASFNSEIFNNRTIWLALGLSEVLRIEVEHYVNRSVR